MNIARDDIGWHGVVDLGEGKSISAEAPTRESVEHILSLVLRELGDGAPASDAMLSELELHQLLGHLETRRARVLGRIAEIGRASDSSATVSDSSALASSERLLTTAEAAEMLNVQRKWLYRRAKTLPFARRISGRKLLFSEAGLRRWVETRR